MTTARYQVRSVLTDPDGKLTDYWQVVDTHLDDDVVASYHDCESADNQAQRLNEQDVDQK
ncbi:hypothetical protein ACUN9Y_14230 [Halomonas sp. V046]|uniref:hypothetical protein n=1 Tax=Halomonas sp. V046 TaxID=3459611 RepID=UPI004044F024